MHSASSGNVPLRLADNVLVVTVIVTGADDAPGTTAGGEKITDAPDGSPLALIVTAPVKGSPSEDTVSPNIAVDPATTVCLETPAAATVKSGIAFTACRTFADVLARKFASPEYATERVCSPAPTLRSTADADPFTSAAVATTFPPSRNSTDPVGTPAVVEATVAFNCRGNPAYAAAGCVSFAMLAAGTTVSTPEFAAIVSV
jgi:hypothetical protein